MRIERSRTRNWILSALLVGALVLLLYFVLGRDDPAGPESPRRGVELEAGGKTVARGEREPDTHEESGAGATGEPSSEPGGSFENIRVRLWRLEHDRRRKLADLLSTRDELYADLFESGLIAEPELLLARIESSFNLAVSSPEDRETAMPRMDAAAEKLAGYLGDLVEAGLSRSEEREGITRAVSALRSADRWFRSPLYLGKDSSIPPTDVDSPEDSTETLRGRSALQKEILLERRSRIREECRELDIVLASDLSAASAAEVLGLRIRRLLGRARLGVKPFPESRDEARQLLADQAIGLDPESRKDLEALTALFDWYGSIVISKLYGD